MTNPSDKPTNTSFSTFGLGVAFGVAAAFLFGTEEGRKIVKRTLDKLPDKYKNPLGSVSRQGGTHSTPGAPPISPEETQHHSVFDPSDLSTQSTTSSLRGTPWQSHSTEAPPPPAPHVRPTRPEPFTPTL